MTCGVWPWPTLRSATTMVHKERKGRTSCLKARLITSAFKGSAPTAALQMHSAMFYFRQAQGPPTIKSANTPIRRPPRPVGTPPMEGNLHHDVCLRCIQRSNTFRKPFERRSNGLRIMFIYTLLQYHLNTIATMLQRC